MVAVAAAAGEVQVRAAPFRCRRCHGSSPPKRGVVRTLRRPSAPSRSVWSWSWGAGGGGRRPAKRDLRTAKLRRPGVRVSSEDGSAGPRIMVVEPADSRDSCFARWCLLLFPATTGRGAALVPSRAWAEAASAIQVLEANHAATSMSTSASPPVIRTALAVGPTSFAGTGRLGRPADREHGDLASGVISTAVVSRLGQLPFRLVQPHPLRARASPPCREDRHRHRLGHRRHGRAHCQPEDAQPRSTLPRRADQGNQRWIAGNEGSCQVAGGNRSHLVWIIWRTGFNTGISILWTAFAVRANNTEVYDASSVIISPRVPVSTLLADRISVEHLVRPWPGGSVDPVEHFVGGECLDRVLGVLQVSSLRSASSGC